jgi:hypothetical protein
MRSGGVEPGGVTDSREIAGRDYQNIEVSLAQVGNLMVSHRRVWV